MAAMVGKDNAEERKVQARSSCRVQKGSPKGTMVAASNQAILGSASRSLASGSRIKKFRNLPYDTKPSCSAPSALWEHTSQMLLRFL